ncbi:MAG: putative hydrolase [Frankiales bacterium]|nr:putative hydrolase [Frankiales bacterium]
MNETTPGTAVPSRDVAVLFDLDGTLVDSNYLHVHAWWEAFGAAGHEVSGRDVHHAIGRPAADLVETLLGHPDQAVVDGHDERWAALRPRAQAYRGAGELLRACAARGWRVVWATSGSPEDIAAFRALLAADDVVHAVISSSDVERGKPHPDVVLAALEAAGVGPQDAVLVGDTVWDAQAARAAGVASIGLLAGGLCEQALRDAGAVDVLDAPADLLADLDRLDKIVRR